MSTGTRSNPSSSQRSGQEPDRKWREDLKVRIEKDLSPLVEKAKEDKAKKLEQASNDEERKLAEENYEQEMESLRRIAREQFAEQLAAERSRRGLATSGGGAQVPNSLIAQQKAMWEAIKGGGGESPREGDAVPDTRGGESNASPPSGARDVNHRHGSQAYGLPADADDEIYQSYQPRFDQVMRPGSVGSVDSPARDRVHSPERMNGLYNDPGGIAYSPTNHAPVSRKVSASSMSSMRPGIDSWKASGSPRDPVSRTSGPVVSPTSAAPGRRDSNSSHLYRSGMGSSIPAHPSPGPAGVARRDSNASIASTRSAASSRILYPRIDSEHRNFSAVVSSPIPPSVLQSSAIAVGTTASSSSAPPAPPPPPPPPPPPISSLPRISTGSTKYFSALSTSAPRPQTAQGIRQSRRAKLEMDAGDDADSSNGEQLYGGPNGDEEGRRSSLPWYPYPRGSESRLDPSHKSTSVRHYSSAGDLQSRLDARPDQSPAHVTSPVSADFPQTPDSYGHRPASSMSNGYSRHAGEDIGVPIPPKSARALHAPQGSPEFSRSLGRSAMRKHFYGTSDARYASRSPEAARGVFFAPGKMMRRDSAGSYRSGRSSRSQSSRPDVYRPSIEDWTGPEMETYEEQSHVGSYSDIESDWDGGMFDLDDVVSQPREDEGDSGTYRWAEELRAREDGLLVKEREVDRRLEDAKKLEVVAKRKEEEAKRREDDTRRKADAILRREDEVRNREEEVRVREDEVRRREDEARRREEDARRKEDDARRKEEDARKKEEDARRREEDARQRTEEARQRGEDVRKLVEEAHAKEERLREKAEELKEREALVKEREQELQGRVEAVSTREDELHRQEEHLNRRLNELASQEEALAQQQEHLIYQRQELDQRESDFKHREDELRKQEEEQAMLDAVMKTALEDQKEAAKALAEQRRLTLELKRAEQARAEAEEVAKIEAESAKAAMAELTRMDAAKAAAARLEATRVEAVRSEAVRTEAAKAEAAQAEVARQHASELHALQEALRRVQEELRQREVELSQWEIEAQHRREAGIQRQRELEAQRQWDLEAQRQREVEAQRQREIEAQRQREVEAQRQREVEAQRQKEMEARQQREAEVHRKEEERKAAEVASNIARQQGVGLDEFIKLQKRMEEDIAAQHDGHRRTEVLAEQLQQQEKQKADTLAENEQRRREEALAQEEHKRRLERLAEQNRAALEEKFRRQQEEEHRKQEERRRAEERKRQDSMGSNPDTYRSSTPYSSTSQAAGWSSSNRSSTASNTSDRASTTSSSSWGSSWSGWSASSGTSHTSQTSRSSTTPTSGSTRPAGAAWWSTSAAHPYPDPAHASPRKHTDDEREKTWREKQEEHARKQAEQFRKEQERLERERQTKAGRIMTKTEVSRLVEEHERQWSHLQIMTSVCWNDVPWPVLRKPNTVEELTSLGIAGYVLNHQYNPGERSDKDRLKEHIRRWHPDRFETKILPKVQKSDQERVKEAAGQVVRVLNELMAQAN